MWFIEKRYQYLYSIYKDIYVIPNLEYTKYGVFQELFYLYI